MTTQFAKTREEVIASMCLTYNHAYNAPLDPEWPELSLTNDERKYIWNQMAQLFDNDIFPNMMFRHEKTD